MDGDLRSPVSGLLIWQHGEYRLGSWPRRLMRHEFTKTSAVLAGAVGVVQPSESGALVFSTCDAQLLSSR